MKLTFPALLSLALLVNVGFFVVTASQKQPFPYLRKKPSAPPTSSRVNPPPRTASRSDSLTRPPQPSSKIPVTIAASRASNPALPRGPIPASTRAAMARAAQPTKTAPPTRTPSYRAPTVRTTPKVTPSRAVGSTIPKSRIPMAPIPPRPAARTAATRAPAVTPRVRAAIARTPLRTPAPSAVQKNPTPSGTPQPRPQRTVQPSAPRTTPSRVPTRQAPRALTRSNITPSARPSQAIVATPPKPRIPTIAPAPSRSVAPRTSAAPSVATIQPRLAAVPSTQLRAHAVPTAPKIVPTSTPTLPTSMPALPTASPARVIPAEPTMRPPLPTIPAPLPPAPTPLPVPVTTTRQLSSPITSFDLSKALREETPKELLTLVSAFWAGTPLPKTAEEIEKEKAAKAEAEERAESKEEKVKTAEAEGKEEAKKQQEKVAAAAQPQPLADFIKAFADDRLQNIKFDSYYVTINTYGSVIIKDDPRLNHFTIYVNNGFTWEQRTIVKNVSRDDASVRTTISPQGSIIAIGYSDNTLHLYSYDKGTWHLQQVIPVPYKEAFGGISQEGMFVHTENQGKNLVIYAKEGTTWRKKQTLSIPGKAKEVYGYYKPILVTSNVVIVQLSKNDLQIYEKSGDGWKPSAKIALPTEEEIFSTVSSPNGHMIAINTIPYAKNPKIFIYEKAGGKWTPSGTILDLDLDKIIKENVDEDTLRAYDGTKQIRSIAIQDNKTVVIARSDSHAIEHRRHNSFIDAYIKGKGDSWILDHQINLKQSIPTSITFGGITRERIIDKVPLWMWLSSDGLTAIEQFSDPTEPAIIRHIGIPKKELKTLLPTLNLEQINLLQDLYTLHELYRKVQQNLTSVDQKALIALLADRRRSTNPHYVKLTPHQHTIFKTLPPILQEVLISRYLIDINSLEASAQPTAQSSSSAAPAKTATTRAALARTLQTRAQQRATPQSTGSVP